MVAMGLLDALDGVFRYAIGAWSVCTVFSWGCNGRSARMLIVYITPVLEQFIDLCVFYVSVIL